MFHARLSITRDDVVAAVSPRLFGSFVEHMGRSVYTGIYEPGHPTANAAGFLKFMNEGEGTQISIDAGGFPSTVADLESPEFLGYSSAYFGGQKINEVLVQSAKDVVPGWSYLPFQVYSNSIFSDTVGQAYASKGDINEGLTAWQKATASYGTEQGFTVTEK